MSTTWAGIGSMADAQHLLEDPHTVIQGDRVLHLRYLVRRTAAEA